MNKFIITVLGKDRPGIIASVSESLYKLDCNLENVNQMILQNEFAGFFIAEHPQELDQTALAQKLNSDLEGTGLRIHVDSLYSNSDKPQETTMEPFLITTIGPDKKGLVSKFTAILAKFGVNITNLTAVFRGGDDPKANVMTYEVAITSENDQTALFKELRENARGLNLDISIQHKNIFRTINKI